MTDLPFGITTFCDDIRFEVGGKTTLIGCYNQELLVVGGLPTTLPIICAFVHIIIPVNHHFERLKLVVSMEEGSETHSLAELEVDRATLAAQLELGTPDGASEKETNMSLTAPFRFSPVAVSHEATLKSRAFLDDRKFRLGTLRIRSHAGGEKDL